MLFEKYADDYSRLRPGYPQDLLLSLIQKLNLTKDSVILDLACGTGILGRHIHKQTKATVFGLDHSPVMLKHCPDLIVACAKAETLPLKPNLFDAVLVGAAFHWFDFNQALDEIARVTKPGAGLAIAWYQRRPPHTGHHLKMDELIKKYNPNHQYVIVDCNWPKIISNHGSFRFQHNFTTECTIKYSIPDYLKLQRSKSYIGDSLPSETLKKFMAEYEEIVKKYFPEGEVSEEMTFFYVSAIKS